MMTVTHERNADKDAAENGLCDEETDGPHDALHRTNARTDAMNGEAHRRVPTLRQMSVENLQAENLLLRDRQKA
jgi:hypothetical protein